MSNQEEIELIKLAIEAMENRILNYRNRLAFLRNGAESGRPVRDEQEVFARSHTRSLIPRRGQIVELLDTPPVVEWPISEIARLLNFTDKTNLNQDLCALASSGRIVRVRHGV